MNSLTTSKTTGNKKIRGKYRINYKKWHIRAKRNNTLFIPYPLDNEKRPFPVNKIMLV